MTVPTEGRRLLKIEVRNSQTPVDRKPEWMRAKVNMSKEYRDMKSIVNDGSLNTVCQEAGCPNIFECWNDKEATFLIGGDACTRRCDFCQIESAKPTEYDTEEPARVADSVRQMGLRYATITGVCRDDLDDLGVWLYAETIKQIHEQLPGVGVEMLAPDFNARPELLNQIFEQRPEVFAHNVETVPRLFKRIRPGFRYERSLDVLRQSRAAGLITKSNLILGMGETNDEVLLALEELHEAGCQLITITQYLRPNVRLLPVDRWVTPAEFDEFAVQAKAMGYLGVMSGPLVRSSYKAGSLYREATEQLGQKVEASRG